MSALSTRITDLATRIATELKTMKTQYSGNNQGDLTGLTTTAKTSLVAAINELVTTIGALGFGDLLSTNNLSDVANAATALGNLGGLSQSEVDARVQLVVDSAPAALDTLNELAAALGDDENFAATMTTALAGKSPTSHTHAGVYEPVFSKNTGFNKNLGTIAGTVAEGNHNHTGVYATSGHAHAGVYSVVGHGHDGIYQPIDADLTAIAALAGTSGFLKKTATNTWSLDTTSYSLSSHNHTGVYEPTFSKNTAFNKNFGTEAGTVSEGNHNHSGIYLESETDPVFTAWDKSTGILITENQISNFGSYAVSGHNHSGTYEPANANIQSHISASSGNPHSVTFAELGGKPTTIAGYGLTDVYSKTEIGTPDTNFVTVFEAGLA